MNIVVLSSEWFQILSCYNFHNVPGRRPNFPMRHNSNIQRLLCKRLTVSNGSRLCQNAEKGASNWETGVLKPFLDVRSSIAQRSVQSIFLKISQKKSYDVF